MPAYPAHFVYKSLSDLKAASSLSDSPAGARSQFFSAPGFCCYNRPMAVYVLALLIGVVAGLRTMTAPAVVSWAAYLGRMTSGRHMACLPGLRLDTIHPERARACGTRHRSAPEDAEPQVANAVWCADRFRRVVRHGARGVRRDMDRRPRGWRHRRHRRNARRLPSSGQGWWRGAAAGTFQSHCLRTRLRLGAGF
jgi:hypothetical protein